MLLNGKPVDAIEEQDLLSLIGTDENKTIDFKKSAYQPPADKTLPPEIREKWKRDLWIDVCSFANANGGWIICGLNDKNGIADDLCGLGTINPDAEVRRLSQCINSGIEPKIPGMRVRDIELSDTAKGYAIVICVPRSFAAPHRVKESGRFHIRRSKENDEMDLGELRTAFNLADTYIDRIRQFRKDRTTVISVESHEDVPVILTDGVRLVLHVVPLSLSNDTTAVDLSAFKMMYPAKWVGQNRLIDYSNYGRFNLEGFVLPYPDSNNQGKHRGYVQIFRNGAMEFVEVFSDNTKPIVDLYSVESYVLQQLQHAWIILENLGVEMPLVVMMSVLGVKGKSLVVQRLGFYDPPPNGHFPVSKENLLIPATVAESYEQDLKVMAKPIFDILWNVGGWQRSLSYDETGIWKRKEH